MSDAQIHLAFVHFPIAGIIFAVAILLIAVWKRHSFLKLVAYCFFIVAGLSSVPVFLSGEGAEEIVEGKPLVTDAIIHTHEEAAELAFYLLVALTILSVAAFILEKRGAQFSRVASFIVLIFGMTTSGFVLQAAHLGGMIRHDELRSSTEADQPGSSSFEDEGESYNSEDD